MLTRAELLGVPVFRNLPEEALDLLTDAMWRRYLAGETIIGADTTMTGIFVILKGSVGVIVRGIRIQQRAENEIVGEQSFIDETVHSATVVADTDAQVLALPAATVHRLMEFPSFRTNLLKTLSLKLRQATADRWERYAEHQRLFREFGAHVDPRVRDALLLKGGTYGDPQHADIVVLFSDLRNFTHAAAVVSDPTAVARALTDYFDAMVEIIHRHEGWVDKYIGDAIMAVWNFPGLPNAAPESALRAAIEMVSTSGCHELAGVPLRTGVGINAGTVFMGNVGSDRKRQYTIIGDAVNRASRFEAQSKKLGEIVCGPEYVKLLDDQTRSLLHATEPIAIPGIDEETVLHVYKEHE